MRRISLSALFISMTLLLSSCIRQEGALVVNPDASITGTVVLGLDRQLSASLGITSLNDVLKQQSAQGASTDGCFDLKSEETASEYVFTCRYKNSKVVSGDMSSVIQNNKIVFTFKSNDDADPNSNTLELGKIFLSVQFPGPIEQIQENKTGLVRKDASDRIRIEGSASEPINVRITSSCGTSCSMELSELTKSYASAPSNFGGMIRTDTVMRKANSPFRIKEMIQIPLGRTLVVEPGVEIIAELGSPAEYVDKSIFFNQGRLVLAGKESERIKISGNPAIVIRTTGSTSASTTDATFTEFAGADYLVYNYGTGGDGIVSISDSLISGMKNNWYIGYPRTVVFVERNVFIDSAGVEIVTRAPEGSTLPSVTVRQNVFLGTPLDSRGKEPSGCWISARATYSTKVIVENNDFSQAPQRVICIGRERDIVVDANSNYWGTTNLKEIEDRVFDSNDALTASSKIILGKPLERSPLEVDPKLRSFSNYVSAIKKNAEKVAKEKADKDAAAAKAASEQAAAKNKAAESQAQTSKSTRITCIRGKSKLKVIGKNAKCPSGYKRA